MSDRTAIHGPHQAITVDRPRDAWLARLFDRLWDRYRRRVTYVSDYERLVAAAGATFVNDHIAFRTLAGQSPVTGIVSLSRIFEAVGYRAAGCYVFEDKWLSAIHYQHPVGEFPKLFISELKTWELPDASRLAISSLLARHRAPLSLETIAHLHHLDERTESEREQLLTEVVDWIETRPWPAPDRQVVEQLNQQNQYAAWVALHGYNVNHFTSLINSHGASTLSDIDKTVAALAQSGVPMKDQVEGSPGSRLRQSATGAAVIDVEVIEHGKATTMPWTYAYFELAERGEVVDPETGKSSRFEGFLGPQATHLFEMTRTSD